MFGPLGMPELVLIFVVALLLFGPRKMPQIGRSIGRALGEFRRASNEFKRTIEDEVAADEIREVEQDLKEIKKVGQEIAGEGIREMGRDLEDIKRVGQDVVAGTDSDNDGDDSAVKDAT